MGQYTAEFRSSRISEGGTFWQVNDTALEGPPFISNPAVPRGASFQGDKGDVALGLKWSPREARGRRFRPVAAPLRRQDAQLAEPDRGRPQRLAHRPRRLCEGHRTHRPDLQHPARRLGHRRRAELPPQDAVERAQRFRLRDLARPRQRPRNGRPARQHRPLPDERRFHDQQERALRLGFDRAAVRRHAPGQDHQRRQSLQRRGRQPRLHRQPGAARLLDAQRRQHRLVVHADVAAGLPEHRHLGAACS